MDKEKRGGVPYYHISVTKYTERGEATHRFMPLGEGTTLEDALADNHLKLERMAQVDQSKGKSCHYEINLPHTVNIDGALSEDTSSEDTGRVS